MHHRHTQSTPLPNFNWNEVVVCTSWWETRADSGRIHRSTQHTDTTNMAGRQIGFSFETKEKNSWSLWLGKRFIWIRAAQIIIIIKSKRIKTQFGGNFVRPSKTKHARNVAVITQPWQNVISVNRKLFTPHLRCFICFVPSNNSHLSPNWCDKIIGPEVSSFFAFYF